MTLDIRDDQFWWVRELYATLAAIADEATNTLCRNGGGRIRVPEDLAEDLSDFQRSLLTHHPETAGLELLQVVGVIEEILARKSRGGEDHEEEFWTNDGFRDHPDWLRIRKLSRSFLIR